MPTIGRENLYYYSVYYFVKDQLASAGWTTVNMRQELPTEDMDLPCVTVENGDTTGISLEMGTRTRMKTYRFILTITGKYSGQDKDIASTIQVALDTSVIPLIDYNTEFPYLKNGNVNTAYDGGAQLISNQVASGIDLRNVSAYAEAESYEKYRVKIFFQIIE